MVTEFEVVDLTGNVIGYGEIEGKTYRLFADRDSEEFQEFGSFREMLSACKGIAIQPSLFETNPRERQLNLLEV